MQFFQARFSAILLIAFMLLPHVNLTQAAPSDNVALSGTTSQSSTHSTGTADKAIDNNTNGDWAAGSVTHTGGDNTSWWEVDLGSSVYIENIVFWRRTACCPERSYNAYVLVSETPFPAGNDLAAARGVADFEFALTEDNYPDPSVDIPVAGTGRYVRIHHSVSGVQLNIAEVQVFEGDPNAPVAISKRVDWNGTDPDPALQFEVNVSDSNGVVATEQLNDGGSVTLLLNKTKTFQVVETSPGEGWQTEYKVGGVTYANAPLITPAGPAIEAVAPAPVTGRVFRDFNGDGVMTVTGGFTEMGVANVTVTAYDPDGIVVGSTLTASDGVYSLTPSADGPWRIGFSNVPTDYELGSGAGGAFSTQFVNTSGANTIDFAINSPRDYCQATPDIVTTTQVVGDSDSTQAPYQTLISQQYGISGSSGHAVLATKSQIGSTWGLAYSRSTSTIYTAAFLKRHAGLGPNGLGAIYATTKDGSTTTLFADLAALGIDVGTIPDNATRGLGDPTAASNDPDAYPLVGKVGLGGIELSADEQTLYVVSLNDKTLYALDVDSGGIVGQHSIPEPSGGCTNGNWRPFATAVKLDKVYVGGICDAAASNDQSDLSAHIYQLDTVTGSFTSLLNFDLDYPKGSAHQTPCNTYKGWYPWQSTLAPMCGPGGVVYPQPVLSDIEFDVNGDIILGFFDRLGHQLGQKNNTPDGRQVDIITGGDLLRVAWVDGAYVLESNASVGGRSSVGANNNQGPGGGEFYFQENYSTAHKETSNGGVALLPGWDEVVVTTMDPIDRVAAGGYERFSNINGTRVDGYEVYIGQRPNGLFGKAHGMGDIELLCDQAPLEIGNRIWSDTDGDGIQDAGEPGISDLTVTLNTSGGPVTTLTDGHGYYHFSVEPDTAYTLSVATPEGYQLTIADAAALEPADLSTNHAIHDTIDSDAMLVDGVPTITYTTGGPGQNNHGLDFGFIPPLATNAVEIINTAPPSVTPVDLELNKSVDPLTAHRGDMAVYTLTLANNSATDANGIEVKDLLPANLTYISSNPQQGTYDAVSGLWVVGSLPANQTATLEITVRVK